MFNEVIDYHRRASGRDSAQQIDHTVRLIITIIIAACQTVRQPAGSDQHAVAYIPTETDFYFEGVNGEQH